MDKRERADRFRERLLKAMEIKGLSRSALARAIQVHRSTLSQILDAEAENARLPNAQLAAEAAEVLGVSADWLLGLTDRPERPGDVIASAVEVSEAQRALVDEELMAWHQEARGYKIRHVPATFPDMLKTQAVLEWEYAAFMGRTPDQAVGAMRDRLNWLQTQDSDYEIAMPIYELDSLARGEGYYSGLSPRVRREQLNHLAEQCHKLYPSLRVHLFDARRLFSAPLTVFGPRIGVLYLGSAYLAFRESSRIRLLSQHFDGLVREAWLDARDFATHAAQLAEGVKGA